MAVNFTTNANQASGQDKILSFQYRSMTNLSIANDGQVLKVREADEYNTSNHLFHIVAMFAVLQYQLMDP